MLEDFFIKDPHKVLLHYKYPSTNYKVTNFPVPPTFCGCAA